MCVGVCLSQRAAVPPSPPAARRGSQPAGGRAGPGHLISPSLQHPVPGIARGRRRLALRSPEPASARGGGRVGEPRRAAVRAKAALPPSCASAERAAPVRRQAGRGHVSGEPPVTPPRPAASGAWLAPPRFFCRARRSRWPRRSRVWSDLRAGALGKAVPACRGAVGGESRPRGNDRGPAGSRSLRRAGRGEVVWVRALLR